MTVDGKIRTLGPAEVQAEIQKGLSGSARLEEAAKAQESVQYAQDVGAALERDDVDAYFRLAEARGWNQEEAQTLLEHFEDEETEEVAEEEQEEAPATPVQYVERQPSVEEKRTQEWARQEQLKQVRQAIHADVDTGLDKDPRFAKIMKAGGKRAEEVRNLARNTVKRIVVSEGVEYTDVVRGQALDEVGHVLEVFGGVATAHGGASGSSLLPPGTGPAPFSGAPEIVMPSPGTTMERPSSSSPKYEDWVTQQIQAAAHEEALQGD